MSLIMFKMKTDREIYLNDMQKQMINKAIADGKKCLIISDLMINIFGAEIEVTNAHTGDVMRVVNWIHPFVTKKQPFVKTFKNNC